ncbi:MAG: MarC family protein [Deltaproteobacteria bacterium]|nr:MarC family protein [Deltaproteobacteria bacterium]
MTVAEYLFIAFPAIFVILNPFSAASSFLILTTGNDERSKNDIAKRACITAFFVLIVFAIAGHFIFNMFNITISAFRIAGGIIMFTIGLSMLQLQPQRIKQTEEEMEESLHKTDVAIVPLGIPLLSGPGAITTVMVLMTEIDKTSLLIGIMQMACLVLSCALSLVLIYYILTHSGKMLDILKVTGVGVMTRIMGLILTVIATQFVINGVKDLLPEFAKLLSHS